MSLLRIDASILGDYSASSALADRVVASFLEADPSAEVVSRHVGAEPMSSQAWPLAVSAGNLGEDQWSDEQRAAVALARELADELRSADAAVLALPLYNYGVSQHAKIWIDLALAGGQMGDRLLDGKPVVLVVTRGGSYAPGTPKEGWDHNVDYLRRIIADVWGADLTVVEREFTLVGVNPALDQFAELAAKLRAAAEQGADEAGANLAATLAA